MNIKPRENRIIVEKTKQENKTKSGILIPVDSSEDSFITAKVIAVGPGEKIKDIEIGDNVIFSNYSGKELKIDNKVYLLLDNENILCKL